LFSYLELAMTATAPYPHTEYSQRAFPELDAAELELLKPLGEEEEHPHGTVLFKAGARDIDFLIVLAGGIDIRNPTDNDSLIITHGPGHFVGDIDLLTRRPVIVTAITNGPTRVLRICGDRLRHLLNTVPRVSDKLLVAFQVRRELLRKAGVLGIKVVGAATCKDTNVAREFLHKNFMPFTWYDLEKDEGKAQWRRLGSPRKTPVIECNDGTILANPTLHDLANCAGVWEGCPGNDFDFAIVGAGPAGMTAAVYAASEGLKTLVVDKLGPGGQAGGSSKIENFIGFPAGLSGADLAQRGVLQMLKFGATMVAPINVQKLIPAEREDLPHVLQLDCGEEIRARTILIATGAYWRRLDAKGADRFMQAGMYYACTQVEGYLYKDKEVAVIGAGNSAGQAVMFLAEHCACKVHMVIRAPELGPGMSDYLSQRIRATPNVVIHTAAEVTEVFGDSRIEGVTVTAKSGGTKRLPVAALFVFIGAEPHVSWLPEGIARDQLGYLLTGVDVVKAGKWPLKDREPCPLETSIPRVLAAGDVRSGSTKRVGFAVGDGSLAVTCAHRLRAAIK
jgi:thioredoxin reductase (NADPH)